MRRHVVGASNLGDTAVSGHDHHGSLVGLKGTIEEGEALDVEHVDLVDKEDTGHDLSTAFLTPLGNLLVDLFAHFWLDLTNVSGEQGHETLRSRVNDINFVKGDRVNDLFALLELTLGALDIASLRTLVVEVTTAGKGTTKLGDLATGLVDGDDVTRHDFLLLNRLDHFHAQVEDGLHLGSLEGDLAGLGTRLGGLVDLDFDDFTLNNFSLLSNADTCDELVSRMFYLPIDFLKA